MSLRYLRPGQVKAPYQVFDKWIILGMALGILSGLFAANQVIISTQILSNIQWFASMTAFVASAPLALIAIWRVLGKFSVDIRGPTRTAKLLRFSTCMVGVSAIITVWFTLFPIPGHPLIFQPKLPI